MLGVSPMIVAMGHQFNCWNSGAAGSCWQATTAPILCVYPTPSKTPLSIPFFAHAGEDAGTSMLPRGRMGLKLAPDAHDHTYADFDGRSKVPVTWSPERGRLTFLESAHSLARGLARGRTLRRSTRALRGNPPHSPASLRVYPESLSDEPARFPAEALTRLYVERLEEQASGTTPQTGSGHTIAGNTAHQNKFSRPTYYTQLKYPHHPLKRRDSQREQHSPAVHPRRFAESLHQNPYNAR